MIDIQLSTYSSEIIEVQAQAVPQEGQYIHCDDRSFIVESVIFQIDKHKIHLSVIELQ